MLYFLQHAAYFCLDDVMRAFEKIKELVILDLILVGEWRSSVREKRSLNLFVEDIFA